MRNKTLDGSPLSLVFYATSEDKNFELSLAISVLMHVLVIASLFYSNVHYTKKVQKNLEIIYQTQIQEIKPAQRAEVKSLRSVRVTREKLAPGIFNKGDSSIPPQFKETGKQPAKFEVPQKMFGKIPASEGKRYVSVPMLDSEKISSPRYLDYHERIRNKIKKRAYLYVDNPRFETGEVYLTFVLSSDGSLKQIKILEERTSANDYLKSVGLRSIQESSPFPPFPKELEYPELSFNVVISFEVSN